MLLARQSESMLHFLTFSFDLAMQTKWAERGESENSWMIEVHRERRSRRGRALYLIRLPAEKVSSKVFKLGAKNSYHNLHCIPSILHHFRSTFLRIHPTIEPSTQPSTTYISSPSCNKAINFEPPLWLFPHFSILDERHLWHGPVKKKNIDAQRVIQPNS